MTIKRYTDRSRIETHQRCKRRRFLEYEESGTGIQPSRKALALVVGGAVHSGLETLLRACMDENLVIDIMNDNAKARLRALEEAAVGDALADFAEWSGKLESDEAPASQSNLIQIAGSPFDLQLQAQAIELGLDPSGFRGPGAEERRSRADAYLFAEQSALVEAMVRAYSRRRLRPLLEEFEVLEVEREGEWLLAEWGSDKDSAFKCESCGIKNRIPKGQRSGVMTCGHCGGHDFCLVEDSAVELWFLSRPDALLRHRQTNELQILSFKTTGAWDQRKARDVQHDMQGLSEGVEIERRLGEWWEQIQKWALQSRQEVTAIMGCAPGVLTYLKTISAAPRVSAIRYEFLLKGERWKDRDLSLQIGTDMRSQKSHLIRQLVAVSTPGTGKNASAFRIGDVCWSNDYIRIEDQKASNLAWQNWKPRAVWEAGTNAIREWIDKLDRSEPVELQQDSTMGNMPARILGYRSPAQAMGVTEMHPLDQVFIPPITISRQDDQLRDWAEQAAGQEREAAEHSMRVAQAKDAGEKRSLLNRLFQQSRSACEYPTTCAFARDRAGVCWGGAEIQASPLEVGGGEYVRRIPNHPRENEK